MPADLEPMDATDRASARKRAVAFLVIGLALIAASIVGYQATRVSGSAAPTLNVGIALGGLGVVGATLLYWAAFLLATGVNLQAASVDTLEEAKLRPRFLLGLLIVVGGAIAATVLVVGVR